jgi:hypothetical protein
MRKILSPFLGLVRKSRHTFLFYPAKDRSTVKTLGTPDYNMCSKKKKKKKTSICASCTKAHRLYDKLYNEEISEPKACWKRF